VSAPDDDPSPGSLRPTAIGPLVALASVAVAGGWLLQRLTARFGTPPTISVAQPLLLFVVAAMLGITAWATWRTLHVRRERLSPHQAVNRLVLARASALVGALTAGGYLGYALSWIGSPDQLADQRMVRSGAAALAGLLIVVLGLLLERACRVRSDAPEN
jgi:hypothetical protein